MKNTDNNVRKLSPKMAAALIHLALGCARHGGSCYDGSTPAGTIKALVERGLIEPVEGGNLALKPDGMSALLCMHRVDALGAYLCCTRRFTRTQTLDGALEVYPTHVVGAWTNDDLAYLRACEDFGEHRVASIPSRKAAA